MSVRFSPKLLLVLFGIGALLVGLLGLRDASGEGSAAMSTAKPERERPRPVQPTKVGAVNAATDFLSAVDLQVLLDDRERERVIRRAAAPEARTELSQVYAEEKRRVAASYRRAPRFARAALAGYRIDEFAVPAATVSIWAAAIGGSGSYAPTTGWSTTTVTLSWIGGRWMVTGVEDSPGPASDWPVATLATEGRRFREYRHVP
jgi:hypothetical protein